MKHICKHCGRTCKSSQGLYKHEKYCRFKPHADLSTPRLDPNIHLEVHATNGTLTHLAATLLRALSDEDLVAYAKKGS